MTTTRRRQSGFNIVVFLALMAGAVLAFAPMLYMVGTSFKENAYVQEIPPEFIPQKPTLENFQTALTSRNFGQAFLNSTFVSVATTVLATLLTAMMAYAFARFEFVGKNVLFYSMLAMMMVPAMIMIIPQFIMAKNLKLLNSLPGIILVYTAGPLAFNTFLLRGFFENLPRELEESALIDGANHFVIFARIIIPLAAPAVSTVAVFTFLGAWGEYILALNFLTEESLRTLPIAIANFQGVHSTDWGLIFAASLTQVVPTVLIFMFFQRYFVQGLTSGAVRG
ncbi:MAG TPA: carbohydrate ABC transporter permease [Phototrophicaceae bacterium]|nr:carbohydrate ABC transporter permease [Phototrophicaceae bacterium]